MVSGERCDVLFATMNDFIGESWKQPDSVFLRDKEPRPRLLVVEIGLNGT